jgi:cytochrome c1
MKLAVLIVGISSMIAVGCRPGPSTEGQSDVATTMRYYGCPACHTIPGIAGANATVGPPLDHLRRRTYLSGTLSNTSQNLSFWIQHPQQIHPGSAMPEMKVTQSDADQIANYLETLN